jgi:hypothetical protein
MHRILSSLFALALCFSLSACKKDGAPETATPDHAHGHDHDHGDGHEHGDGHDAKHGDFEGREVVDNWNAQTGDITVCPISGKKFEVAESSPRFDYEGHSFVLCCGHCLSKVEADPSKLDALVAEAAQ